MISVLFEAPTTQQEWQRWSLHHAISHDAIREAIFKQQTLDLTRYILDPFPTNKRDLEFWLLQNQLAHADISSATNVLSQDLSSCDFTNRNQLVAWIYLHWQAHVSAEAALGIGS